MGRARKAINRIVIVSSVFFLQACSSHTSPQDSRDSSNSNQEAIVEVQEPLALEIERSVNDGRALHVFGIVSVLSPVPRAEVAISLIGLGDGQILREQAVPLTYATGAATKEESLQAGDKIPVYLSIPATDLSDFQLQVLWGQEARLALKEFWAAPERAIEVKNVSVAPQTCVDCKGSPDMAVGCELVNRGVRAIRGTRLAIHFPETLDSAGSNNQNERLVNVAPLNLAPGQRQMVRFLVGREYFERMTNSGAQGVPQILVRTVEFVEE